MLAARSNPLWVALLFRRAEEWEPEASEAPCRPLPASALVARASGAFYRSLGRGFRRVAAETFVRRWEACSRCPNLMPMPERFIYYLGRRVMLNRDDDTRISRLCGCFARSKAARETEHCPAPHPALAGQSRWGEPRPKPNRLIDGHSPRTDFP